jgi:hypothetical protein
VAKSAYVTALDQIQVAMTELLKPLGFKKSGRAYNRAMKAAAERHREVTSGDKS